MKKELLLCEVERMFDKIKADDVTYDNDLASIIYSCLEAPIASWCASDSRLKGKQLEGDLLNEVYEIVSRKIVTHFLRRNGFDAPINDDAEGFIRWIKTVAANHVKNVADMEGRRRVVPIETPDDDDGAVRYEYHEPSSEDEDAELESKRELISAALDVALDKNSEAYIVFAWLAVSFHVLENNVQNHVAIRMVVDEYSDKPLFEVRDAIYSFADRSAFFLITAEKRAEIDRSLNELHESGRRKGDMRWEELYINNNGRGTLSRWVSRMNEHIRRRMKDNGSSNI